METQQNIANTHLVEYDGKTTELYKIFFLNLFLGIITLGIYHFWGKTRKRRYMTASFSLLGDRFEYTGYGGELFKGFVKALAILLVVSIPLFWAFYQVDLSIKKIEEIANSLPIAKEITPNSSEEQKKVIESKAAEMAFEKLTPDEQGRFYGALTIFAVYFIFYYGYIPFVAVYGSLRYRASRTRWRGISAHMKGSSLAYGLIGLMHFVLKVLTLGFWIPIADLMTYRYKMKRLFFGSLRASFTPKYGRLFLSYLLTLLFAIVLAALFTGVAFFLYPPFTAPAIAHPVNGSLSAISHHIPMDLLGTALFIFLGAFFIARYWYKATYLRLKYEGLQFGQIGFRCDVSGWQFLRQLWGNMLITIFTLGLGAPIVTQRRQRFFCEHVLVTGDIEKLMILQASGAKETGYEGLSSVFDLDIGLF